MNKVKKAWDFIRDIFGFRKNSSYVKSYLNDSNVKSSIYMSFIIILLEIWMILRRFYLDKYIPDHWAQFDDKFQLLFAYTGQYVLFTLSSVSMFLFGIFYQKENKTKATFIASLIIGALDILWFFLLFVEIGYGNVKGASVSSVITIIIYSIMPILGAFIIANTFYSKKYDNDNSAFSTGVVICFSLICLLFGISVGYSDFTKSRMIICFLTMVIFVACLLIWKPYFSMLMLIGIFLVFFYMLRNFEGRPMSDELSGDEINYITFLISLSMVTMSIYQQRVTEAKKDEKLIHDAIYDHLSGIHNVKYMSDRIVTESMINTNYLDDKIYLFINIANFRIINDQKGFDFGDRFLIRFAKNVERVFKGDLVSRQADDHYVVFTNADAFMEKLDRLEKLMLEASEGLYIRIKCGGYRPKPTDSPNRSIDKARYACGIIKRKSDVRFLEYTDEMDEKFKKRQYVVNHLNEAIEKDWIKAYYQPVVWCDTKHLCGAEALARWIDPVYGFLSPADFIPVLEDTRLIYKLDEAIVKYVCSNMRRAIDEGRPVVPVSINFSRLDFELMDVVNVIEENVAKYNIDKNFIHVEITESALSNEIDTMTKTLKELESRGYAIWLDDFGSGYSSLNVLKDFKFDVIKIDMTFLSNFDTNEKTKDVLDCIIHLADRLGMKTLSEGVETKAEADFLQSIGCGRLQGYLFGKPYKVNDFEDMIQNGDFTIAKEKF